MANQKISGSPVVTPVAADLVPLVTDVAGTPTNSHALMSNFNRDIDVTDEETSAGATIVDATYPPLNVRRYGAIGDGVTDDSNAFIDAWKVATTKLFSGPSFEQQTMEIGSGQYLVITNNWMSDNITNNAYSGLMGFAIRGDGYLHSSIIFRPTVSGGAMYDQSTAGNHFGLTGFTMSGCSIYLDNASNGGNPVHAFITEAFGGQATQQLSFRNMFVTGEINSIFLQTTGSVNEDVVNFERVSFVTLQTIVKCTNTESLGYFFRGCDAINMWGNMFEFNKGGDLTVTGGIYQHDIGATGNVALLTLTGGTTSRFYKFTGVRTELRGINSWALYMDTPSENTVVFDTCSFFAGTGFNHGFASVPIQHNAKITFENCILPRLESYAITAITKANPAVFTTSASHTLSSTESVDIDNIVDNGPGGDIESTFNGNKYVATVISPTTFSVPVDSSVLTNAWASGGTVEPDTGKLILTDSTNGIKYSATNKVISEILFEDCSYEGDRVADTAPYVDFSNIIASVNQTSCIIRYHGCDGIPDSVEHGAITQLGRTYYNSNPPKLLWRGEQLPVGDGAAVVNHAADYNIVVPRNNYLTDVHINRGALGVTATSMSIEVIDQAERDSTGSGTIYGVMTAQTADLAIDVSIPIQNLFSGDRKSRTLWLRLATGVTVTNNGSRFEGLAVWADVY